MQSIHREGSPRVHAAKLVVHGLLRRARWWWEPGAFPAPRHRARLDGLQRAHQARIPLSRRDAAADPVLEAGKRVNVRLAALRIDESWISVDHPFSFWRTVGRIRAADGFRAGLEIHGGCLVPSLGGGVCLLANALFEAAVRSGLRILERHGHTREAVPHEGPVWGLDATVHHPHVDLRFAPRQGHALLRTRIEGDELVVEVFTETRPPRVRLVELDTRRDGPYRENRVVRHRYGTDGELLGSEIVSENRRLLLHAGQQRRTCRTCGETTCTSRERFLAVETA